MPHIHSFKSALAKAQADVSATRLFNLDQTHQVGVVKISNADDFWEQHNSHEEILVILEGEAVFQFKTSRGLETEYAQAGDVVHIPRGIVHGAHIISELSILFISPLHGNLAWSEKQQANQQVINRHADAFVHA